MGRQVVSIHCGQTGIRWGSCFWELLLAETDLTYEGLPACSDESTNGREDVDLEKSVDDCFFYESEAGKKVPRCTLLDLDSEIHNEIAKSRMSDLFAPTSLVNGKEDAGCLYPRGRRLGSSSPISNLTEEALRLQLEATDSTGGVLCLRSLGGGAGSGFGEEILSFLSAEAPKAPLLETVLWPATQNGSHQASDSACLLATQSASCLEPYNTLLAAEGIIERGGGTLLIDNGAVSSVFAGARTGKKPYTRDLNQIVAQVLASVTLSLRFPSASTCSLSELLGNSIPLPTLSYLSAAYAPLVARDRQAFFRSSIKDITLEAFKQKQCLFSAIQSQGMFLTANLLYRGDISSGVIQDALLAVKQQGKVSFVDWIPTSFKASYCPRGPFVESGGPLAAPVRACCLIANNTSNASHMKRTIEVAKKMLAKRAFVFRYVGEGLEEGEFGEAIERIQSVFDAYEEAKDVHENSVSGEEEEEGEEEEKKEQGKEEEDDEPQTPPPMLDKTLLSEAATVVGDDESPVSAVSTTA